MIWECTTQHISKYWTPFNNPLKMTQTGTQLLWNERTQSTYIIDLLFSQILILNPKFITKHPLNFESANSPASQTVASCKLHSSPSYETIKFFVMRDRQFFLRNGLLEGLKCVMMYFCLNYFIVGWYELRALLQKFCLGDTYRPQLSVRLLSFDLIFYKFEILGRI